MTMKPWLVPDPWEREQDEARAEQRRERERERERRRRQTQQRRDYLRAYRREYSRAIREQAREARWGNAVGSLHSLSCTGPHRKATRKCRPIPVYEGER